MFLSKQSKGLTSIVASAAQRSVHNNHQKVLQSLSKNVITAEYAVRGQIPLRGEEITKQLQYGDTTHYQFAQTTALNIGNPQAVGQGTITFNRQVISGMLNQDLLETDAISEDAKNRCREFIQNCKSPPGAYTSNSKGWSFVRKSVAEFIKERDGIEDVDPDDIYLTNGASEGVRIAFRTLIRNPNDGILVPIPQYPLYSALLTLDNGELLAYYLDEEKNWALDAEALEAKILKAYKSGITPRAIVVINPGNPTGQVMERSNLEEIVRLCYEHNIVILADEVYQQNVYKEGKEFVSLRRVLHEMGEPYSSEVEMISVNSISKGLLGECGLRGGYFETVNMS